MSAVVTSDCVQRYEDLFRDYAQLVYRTAYGVTGSHEDAEDVLQTIFLGLIRREVPPDLARNAEGYFYRAAVNMSLNKIRSRRRQRLVDDDEALERAEPNNSKPLGSHELLNRELYDAIAKLNPDHAQILILRYMHDKSDAEIAKIFGVSRGTIAVKLFRSRARLRKLLRARLGDTL
jgi:RNA polymerase sigma-70 factor (ECF subfamily)